MIVRSFNHIASKLVKPVVNKSFINTSTRNIDIIRTYTATSTYNNNNLANYKPGLLTLSIWNIAKSIFINNNINTLNKFHCNTSTQLYHSVKQTSYTYKNFFLFNAKHDASRNNKRSYGGSSLVALAVLLCAANTDDSKQYDYNVVSGKIGTGINNELFSGKASSYIPQLPSLFTTVLTHLLNNNRSITTTTTTTTTNELDKINMYGRYVSGNKLILTSRNIHSLQHWSYVLQYIPTNQSINELHIKSIELTGDIIQLLIKYNTLRYIKHIRLFENSLGTCNGKLSELLVHCVIHQCSTQLISLAIIRNNLTYNDMRALCELIECIPTLCTLNLSYNGLCNNSAAILGNILDHTVQQSKLRDIDLTMNCISVSGKTVLREIQNKFNQIGIWLDISHNPTRRY